MPFYREDRNEYAKHSLEDFLALLRFQSQQGSASVFDLLGHFVSQDSEYYSGRFIPHLKSCHLIISSLPMWLPQEKYVPAQKLSCSVVPLSPGLTSLSRSAYHGLHGPASDSVSPRFPILVLTPSLLQPPWLSALPWTHQSPSHLRAFSWAA